MTAEREAGPLKIDERLRESLARYRVQMAVTTSAQLPLEAVREVESKLGTRLNDGVLALLAATGRDPYQVLVLTEDAREEHSLPLTYVAFAQEAASGNYWCVDGQAPTTEPSTVMQWSIGAGEVDMRWRDLAAFLTARFDLERRLSSAERVQFSRERESLEPSIVAAGDVPEPRRVYHPNFGVGVVLREVAGKQPKLDVDFGPAGRRLMLASYVRDVETVGHEGGDDAHPPDRSPAAA